MTDVRQRTFLASPALLIGAGAGLLLGLLIGWVIWPVEWQGAQLNELYPEAKADYLVAVAEAYTMYGSPEAAAVARQRVAAFGDDLAAEFESAIAEVSKRDDPDKALRISNLNSLAAALDVTLPNLVGFTQEQPQQTATVVSTPATQPSAAPVSGADDATPTSGAGGLGWLGWLFGLLVAVALVLGGVYFLLLLARRNQQTVDDAQLESKIDDRFAALKADEAGGEATAGRYIEADTPARSASSGHAGVAIPFPGEPEEYEFDDDPEDYSGFPAVAPGSTSAAPGHYTQYRLDSDHADSRHDLSPNDDELWGVPTTTDADDDDGDDDDDGVNGFASGAATRAGVAAAAAGKDRNQRTDTPVAPTTPTGRSELAARPTTYARGTARYKQLEVYIAQYQAGIQDYDETHPITDPATGRYIGECGMGVSTKNGLLNRSEEVVALEVWLFDKTDEKNMGSQTRVLLSEYAVDHNLDQAFLRERQDDPRPFTAQPNVRFQLESQNLLLDCTITEAIYTPSGPTKGTFQSVTVEMSVHRRV